MDDGSRYVVGVNVDITDTKRAVLAAERSRGFLDALVAALPQPVFVKDRSHRYVILNDAFCQAVGKSRTELLGRTDFDAFAQDVAAANWEEDDKVFDTAERFVGVQTFHTLAGASGWLYKTKVLLRLPEGSEYLVGAAADITLQKEAALEVERSRRFLDAVLNAIPGAVVVKDLGRRVVVANDALCRTMQRPREALIGTRLEDALSPEARHLMEAQDDEAFTSEGVVSFEHRPYAPGDRADWILETKHAVTLADGSRYMVGVNTDVTALKRAEHALRETQERLRVLNEIAGAMARMLGLDEVRRRAVQALARDFGQARVCIATMEPDGCARVAASSGCAALPVLTGRELDLRRVPMLLGQLRAGNVSVRADFAGDDEALRLFEAVFEGPVRASLHAPLRLGTRLVGSVWVDSPVPRNWTEHEHRTLVEAADYIVIALESARVERARQDAEAELRRHRDNLQELVAQRTRALREAMEAAERAKSRQVRIPHEHVARAAHASARDSVVRAPGPRQDLRRPGRPEQAPALSRPHRSERRTSALSAQRAARSVQARVGRNGVRVRAARPDGSDAPSGAGVRGARLQRRRRGEPEGRERGPFTRVGRRRPDRPGGAQSPVQRDQVHLARRAGVHRPAGDGGLCRYAGAACPAGAGDRFRNRNSRAGTGSGLPQVRPEQRHAQQGRRDGPGPGHLPRDRPGARREDLGRE
ncbi:MAG: PAS domain-containing protein [Burkholderiales bacterium]|nr:PAS domain-containing protein [Burkholderiales bacterium]